MSGRPTTKDWLDYFRMGLVTGLVTREEMVSWADAALLRDPDPPYEMIELALAGQRPYSEIIWLLNSLSGEPDYDLSLKLLLAQAGVRLAAAPERAEAIIMGLRLLNEEEHFPKPLRYRLSELRHLVDERRAGACSPKVLADALAAFLAPYGDYQPLLAH